MQPIGKGPRRRNLRRAMRGATRNRRQSFPRPPELTNRADLPAVLVTVERES